MGFVLQARSMTSSTAPISFIPREARGHRLIEVIDRAYNCASAFYCAKTRTGMAFAGDLLAESTATLLWNRAACHYHFLAFADDFFAAFFFGAGRLDAGFFAAFA